MSAKRKPKGVAQQLMDLEEQLDELIDAAPDARRRKKLEELQKTVAEESRRLIRKNLKASSEEYEKAAAGLEEAVTVTRAAIDEVNSVKAAIDAIAKAVDLVAKVIG